MFNNIIFYFYQLYLLNDIKSYYILFYIFSPKLNIKNIELVPRYNDANVPKSTSLLNFLSFIGYVITYLM